eukprot:CAMPEP_0168539020 /NCGR_PEP_ID=MMETSP0405-20121227/21565_1 /TAXON_ID=498012 /ORGANISM="Trichosphaerium sp, Strain Am-I-7 wt" /LENGTH=83 /DNA_ID=CAMNT_0008568475 /DNA_START=226 /DNA_END=477 /DNA_ORIENTATION=+
MKFLQQFKEIVIKFGPIDDSLLPRIVDEDVAPDGTPGELSRGQQVMLWDDFDKFFLHLRESGKVPKENWNKKPMENVTSKFDF